MPDGKADEAGNPREAEEKAKKKSGPPTRATRAT